MRSSAIRKKENNMISSVMLLLMVVPAVVRADLILAVLILEIYLETYSEISLAAAADVHRTMAP